MTVLILRDVADRYRGFAASIMPELAPGVYVSPDLTRAVRARLWAVVAGWWDTMPGGSLMMVWRDESGPGRLGVATLGLPRRELRELDGALLVRRE